MSEFKVDAITNRNGSYGPQICGITTFGSSGVTLPSGPTEMRGGGRGRAVFAGGYTPSSPNNSNVMDFVEIATTGDAKDFGDLARSGSTGSTSNSIRGVFNYGDVPNSIVEMDYTIISSGGGVADFGELSFITRDGPFGAGDNTRGILGGSAGSASNMGGSPGKGVSFIDFITFSTTGNAERFGDLTVARRGVSACSSPTRTVWGGGYIKPQNHTITIDFVTTQTKGDATKFGELTLSRGQMGAVSSPTRGIWFAGSIYGPDAPAYTIYNVIDYITIASEGNAIDFGDSRYAVSGIHFTTATGSNSIRGVFGGGSNPSVQTEIQYITIASTGNASDFGDLSASKYNGAGASDSHGGLAQ
tara:strand:- start:25 stop:1101 length:1077 start_codon:yes stop_codon:yes gene_type:complete